MLWRSKMDSRQQWLEEILEKILSRLPVTCIMRNRLVCKRWSSISFVRRLVESYNRPPWLCLFGCNGEYLLYDTETFIWHKASQPSLLLQRPLASAGGLVCLSSASSKSISLFNPLTCSEHSFSAGTESGESTMVMGVSMRIENNTNKVLTVSKSQDPRTLALAVYAGKDEGSQINSDIAWNTDSKGYMSGKNPTTIRKEKQHRGKRKAKHGRRAKKRRRGNEEGEDMVYYFVETEEGDGHVVACPGARERLFEEQRCIWHEDKLYFLTAKGSVIACDVTKGLWCDLPCILPPTLEHSLDLTIFRGRVLVVVLTSVLESFSVRLYEFSWEEWKWNEVGSLMPESFLSKFQGVHHHPDVQCCSLSAASDTVFVLVVSEQACGVFTLDVERNVWQDVGGPPGYFKWPGYFSAFCIQPSC